MTMPDYQSDAASGADEREMTSPSIDWEAVYWAQMPRIYNFFYYRLGDEELAKDLTATTFTKAWRARDQYRHDLGVFEAWLFTIARNVANDHLRKTSRLKEVPLDAIIGLASDLSVEKTAQKRREFERLHALIKTLPTRDQELIAMKYGAGMTNRAIAAATGLTESNIGTILHRTVRRLRRLWEQDI